MTIEELEGKLAYCEARSNLDSLLNEARKMDLSGLNHDHVASLGIYCLLCRDSMGVVSVSNYINFVDDINKFVNASHEPKIKEIMQKLDRIA